MKKILMILFCILASMPVFAQMQGMINASSERVIPSFSFKNNTKSLPYKDGIITSANAEQTNSATFYLTMPGTSGVSYASLHGIEVEDFSILGDMLFFCGNNQFTALIGWVNISDLFYGSASIDVQYFIGYQNAYRIEAYQDNFTNKVNLAVLAVQGNTYYLIDYPTDNSVMTYDYYSTSTEIMTDLAQTDNRIVALLDRKNYTDFSLLEYIKGNIQNNISMAYQFTPGTYSMTSGTPVGKDDSTSYILTTEVGTENVFVCAQIKDSTISYGKYHIDLVSFNPIGSQSNVQMLYPTNHNISNASKFVMQVPYSNGFMNCNINCQY